MVSLITFGNSTEMKVKKRKFCLYREFRLFFLNNQKKNKLMSLPFFYHQENKDIGFFQQQDFNKGQYQKI